MPQPSSATSVPSELNVENTSFMWVGRATGDESIRPFLSERTNRSFTLTEFESKKKGKTDMIFPFVEFINCRNYIPSTSINS